MARRLNQVLARTTGYSLHRVSPARPARQPAGSDWHLPEDIEAEAAAIIDEVRPYTMTSPEKLYGLITATRHVVRHRIPGAVIECGVWRGGSMHAVARLLLAQGVDDRELYLFDTYQGMPAPDPVDRRHDGRSAADLLAGAGENAKVRAYASLADVKDGFRAIPYPTERLHFIQGRVEDTLPDQAPDQIAILRLDTDWYASTAHELRHLYDRLVPGGILILDDYGWWQGARLAVDEFLARTGAPLYLARMGTGRIAVKPLTP
jgi:O-methyltransferase